MDENKFNEFKLKISDYISFCDWTVAEDSPLSDDLKKEWIEYRKKLEALKDTTNFEDVLSPGALGNDMTLILPDNPPYE